MTEDLSILTRGSTPPDQSLHYGTSSEQLADVRFGAQGAQRPLLVLVHGGFWKPQYDRAHAQSMSTALAAAGWTVLTLEYRRVPARPDATLQDIRYAVQRLPGHLDRHNGQVLLVGHSAGGHLVLWAAANAVSKALCGVLALAPVAALELAHRLNLGDGAVQTFLGTEPSERADIDPMHSPEPAVPVTILQGTLDEVVPPAVVKSYCASFPRTRLLLLPDTGHFALIDPMSSVWSIVVQELRQLSAV
jgi:acetyl esterase/lipase